MASDFAQTLKQQADIVRVVGDYVSLKKAGAQNYSGLCPFHKEKTPSFSVHSARQYFYCFGCGEKGDVFSFVQKIENISFPEAVRAVAQACAANPLAVAVPCHRVVRNDGGISGYRWGVQRKRALLKREAAE